MEGTPSAAGPRIRSWTFPTWSRWASSAVPKAVTVRQPSRGPGAGEHAPAQRQERGVGCWAASVFCGGACHQGSGQVVAVVPARRVRRGAGRGQGLACPRAARSKWVEGWGRPSPTACWCRATTATSDACPADRGGRTSQRARTRPSSPLTILAVHHQLWIRCLASFLNSADSVGLSLRRSLPADRPGLARARQPRPKLPEDTASTPGRDKRSAVKSARQPDGSRCCPPSTSRRALPADSSCTLVPFLRAGRAAAGGRGLGEASPTRR